MGSDQNILDPLDHKATNYTPDKHLVNHGKRILNSIIDKFFVLALSACFFVLLLYAFNFLFNGRLRVSQSNTSICIWLSVVITAAHFAYYVILESAFGLTIGKFITDSKVVDLKGETPNISIIFKRTLSRLVPLDALSFLGELPRGWHDEWSDTYVVNRSK